MNATLFGSLNVPGSVPVHSVGSDASWVRSTDCHCPVPPPVGGSVHVTHTFWTPALKAPITCALTLTEPPLTEASTPVTVGGAARVGAPVLLL